MRFDLVIRNGQLVIPFEGTIQGSIGVSGGQIATIARAGDELDGRRVVDARQRYLLPGVIDPHVHMGYLHPEEPGLEFATETAHAALGGVTTIMKMERSFGSYDHLTDVIATGERHSLTDFGIHITVMSDAHLTELPSYARTFGVTSFKFFMGKREQEPGSLTKQGVDDGMLWEGLRTIATIPGGVALVHAENQDIIWRARREWRAAGRGDNELASWSHTSPPEAEAENVLRAGFFGHRAGCPVYVVHLSSGLGLEAVEKLQREGVRIAAETCPHYLTHDEHSAAGRLAKVNPPLRTAQDSVALWGGLERGVLRHLGSDHGAKPLELKKPDANIWETGAGFPGSMHILPVLLSEGVNKGRLDIRAVAEATSAETARTFGLRNKGRIAPGADADLVLVDLDLEKTVSATWHLSGAPYSVYEGWKLKGWPVMTIRRGEVMMEDGRIVGRAAGARYLRRN